MNNTNNNSKKNKHIGRSILMALTAPALALSATAVIWPSVRSCRSNSVTSRDVEVDPTESSETTISSKATTTGIEITVTAKESTKTVDSIKEIRIGDKVLSADEYSFDPKTGVITIKIDVLEKHSGKIVVTPSVVEKKQVSILITSKHKEVMVNQSVVTSAKLTYSNADSISWTQSSTDGGQVSFNKKTTASEEEIEITGVSKGSVKITATCGSVSDSFTISVKQEESLVVEIHDKPSQMIVSETMTTFATITRSNQDVITWTQHSDDGGKVSFSKEETASEELIDIHASKVGTVTITATCGSASDSFTVTINEVVEESFKIDASTGYISMTDAGRERLGLITIPAKVNGITVKGIYGGGCAECNAVEIEFEEPANIEYIGEYAFGGSPNLETIEIPANITSLEGGTFYNCLELSNVTFAENCKLETIGHECFELCSKLESINLPASVSAIGEGVFAGAGVKEVVINSTNKWVQNGRMVEIDITNPTVNATNLKNIGYAVEDNWGYTGINIAVKFANVDYEFDDFYYYGIELLEGCTEYIERSEGKKDIIIKYENEAGEDVEGYVILADYNNYYGFARAKTVFSKDGGEIKITLNDYDWSMIKNPGDIRIFFTKEIFDIDEDTGYVTLNNYGGYICDCVTVPTKVNGITVKGIDDDGFEYTYAKEVKFETQENIEYIGENAFYNNEHIETIEIPANVTILDEGCFERCTSLTNVTFAENSKLTLIRDYAFAGCEKLKEITLPASINVIYCDVFEDSGIEKVTFADTSKVWVQDGYSLEEAIDISNPENNATYLKNCDGGTENNWGYTGICIYFKRAWVSYDNSFSGSGIKLNSSKTTGQVGQGVVDTLTISGTADTEVTGTLVVKTYNNETLIRSIPNVTFNTTESTIKIDLTDEDWEKLDDDDSLIVTFFNTNITVPFYENDYYAFYSTEAVYICPDEQYKFTFNIKTNSKGELVPVERFEVNQSTDKTLEDFFQLNTLVCKINGETTPFTIDREGELCWIHLDNYESQKEGDVITMELKTRDDIGYSRTYLYSQFKELN